MGRSERAAAMALVLTVASGATALSPGPAAPLSFFILLESDFGSKSPAMHNAAFRSLGLPHHYGVVELPKAELEDATSAAAETLRARFAAPDFGGASVTIPHKQTVLPFLDVLTDAARRIGAVNTVIPPGAGKLTGDNTDWLGVCDALDAALERRQTPANSRRALLVGAGGTARAAAYALTEGSVARGGEAYELLVHARSPDKARELARAFGGEALDDAAQSGDLDVVVSTIPGDARFELPPECFRAKPAVLDAAYKPAETALLAQARSFGCPVAQGATMLWYQGVAQFELWTGRHAPRDVMRAAVFDKDVPDLETCGSS
eukprot:CAMPEP_0198653212 /NCGR_PEP_ID=MMETSP1467-20131203/6904_1 /TAXON_ID=1462469 /ORGANISM="unid. sp., Strain CCMP2135" /LENGTH=319 /DNA_ID=CAMNT_0044389171 /DNA_START=1 /DNA_END=960 /DNA_ORIENTATION=-